MALFAAGWRLAGAAGAVGVERAIAAAPIAAAAAVVEAVALGALALAGSTAALAAAAIVTWLALRAATPHASSRGGTPGPWSLAAIGAVGGVAAWALLYPRLGFDGSTYHVAEIALWVQRGTTGSVEPVISGFPVGNYPVTNEALVAWGAGLAHSFAPLAAWTAAAPGLFLAAAWIGLRRVRVPRAIAVLAIVAVCSAPITLEQIVQPQNDFAALAWLTVCGALVVCSLEVPPLLAFAVVAAGLAIGTKTTAAPLALVAIGAGLFAHRGALKPLLRPLGIAALAAALAGGLWYARNLLSHGSPLWPLASTSFGDPVPAVISKLDYSLLERPLATLRVHGLLSYDRQQLSGGALLLAVAPLAWLWSRSRAVAAASVAAVGSLLLWAAAPFTGVGDDPSLAFWPFTTIRYALPSLAAAAFAIALAGRGAGRGRVVSGAVLAAAIAWNAVQYVSGSSLPGDGVLLVLAAAGAAVGLVARAIPARARLAAALVGLGILLAGLSEGYVERDSRPGDVVEWFRGQSAWKAGHGEVAGAPVLLGVLAGDRLRHRLELIPDHEPCSAVAARGRRGWIVITRARQNLFPTPPSAETCLAGRKPRFEGGLFRVYGGPSDASATTLRP